MQERLATLKEFYQGIRPQMTPPSSIMGQIVVAGIYRQAGPEGGQLARLMTDMMAELVVGDKENFQIQVWQPVNRHDKSTWKKVETAEFQWNEDPNIDAATRQYPVGTAIIRLEGNEHRADFFTDEKQQLELRTVADWVIRPRLLKTTEMTEVFMLGGDRKQYQILIDPPALLEYDVTVQN